MKNKIFKIIACLILCCTFIMLTSCAKGEEEKYSLCEMDFFGVDVAAYEYNDIYINKTKHTYKVENKVKENGIVTTQKGKYKVSKTEDGKEYIEVTSSNNGVKFLLVSGEECYFTTIDGVEYFILEGEYQGNNVSMTFKK